VATHRAIPLLAPALRNDLAAWLDHYGVGLGP
jgi:hypothetical protein